MVGWKARKSGPAVFMTGRDYSKGIWLALSCSGGGGGGGSGSGSGSGCGELVYSSLGYKSVR